MKYSVLVVVVFRRRAFFIAVNGQAHGYKYHGTGANFESALNFCLLGTNFGNGGRPISNFSADSLRRLRQQLFYQLNKRVSFVPAPDKLAGKLLFDLGNIDMLIEHYKNALDVYTLARLYGFNTELAGTRFALVEAIVNDDRHLTPRPQLLYKDRHPFWLFIAGTVVAALLAATAVFRKRRPVG